MNSPQKFTHLQFLVKSVQILRTCSRDIDGAPFVGLAVGMCSELLEMRSRASLSPNCYHWP